MNHIQEIAGKVVLIQSCWLDGKDIQANIQLWDGSECVHRLHVRFKSNGRIEYPYFEPFKRQGKQMTHAEFDLFMIENRAEVLELVVSLLTPEEKAQMARPFQASLFEVTQ